MPLDSYSALQYFYTYHCLDLLPLPGLFPPPPVDGQSDSVPAVPPLAIQETRSASGESLASSGLGVGNMDVGHPPHAERPLGHPAAAATTFRTLISPRAAATTPKSSSSFVSSTSSPNSSLDASFPTSGTEPLQAPAGASLRKLMSASTLSNDSSKIAGFVNEMLPMRFATSRGTLSSGTEDVLEYGVSGAANNATSAMNEMQVLNPFESPTHAQSTGYVWTAGGGEQQQQQPTFASEYQQFALTNYRNALQSGTGTGTSATSNSGGSMFSSTASPFALPVSCQNLSPNPNGYWAAMVRDMHSCQCYYRPESSTLGLVGENANASACAPMCSPSNAASYGPFRAQLFSYGSTDGSLPPPPGPPTEHNALSNAAAIGYTGTVQNTGGGNEVVPASFSEASELYYAAANTDTAMPTPTPYYV